MSKTLLWELICALTTAEKRRAVKFMASPFCNVRADAALLFDILIKLKRMGKSPNRELVFAMLYEDLTYDDQRFRLIQSHLYKCLERFLTWETCEAQTAITRPLLLQAFRQRNLHRHLSKTLNAPLPKEPQRPELQLAHYQYERERFGLLAQSGRNVELNLQQSEDALDDAFVAYKLRQACFTRSHETVFRKHYELRFMPAILDYAKQSEDLVLKVYHACYIALFEEPTEINFQRFRELLLAHGTQFPAEEMRAFYVSALNYCIRRINENQTAYLKETLDLYKSGLATKALLEKDRVSRFTFNNLVGIAIRLDELSYVEFFLKEYSPALPEEWRSPTLALNRARLAYARREFDDALIHLRATDHRDLITNMTGKILQAKIYYDTEQFELLDAHLHTMQRFLRRNKKMAYHHENWSNVLRYFRKLNELNRHDAAEVHELSDEIREAEVLTEKEWLLARVK